MGDSVHHRPPDHCYPIIDDDRFVILWNGVEVKLGNTDRFRLARALVRCRRRNVSHEDIRGVQDKPDMTPEAIRQAVRNLKKRLPADLAQHIVAEFGHYSLDLRR